MRFGRPTDSGRIAPLLFVDEQSSGWRFDRSEPKRIFLVDVCQFH